MDPRERLHDPEETLRLAIQGALSSVWTALPCIVQTFDPVAQTVTAQPAIKAIQQLQDNTFQAVQMPLLLDVPVVFQRGGGVTLTFPIKPGDECVVVFMNRNFDAWWQSGGVQQPLDARRFSLSDGMAFVGPLSQPKRLSGYSTTTVQLRNDAGTAFYEINPTTLAARIEATGGLTIHGAVTILNGGVTMDGSAVVAGDVTAGTISLRGHIHGGVKAGPDTTQGPQ